MDNQEQEPPYQEAPLADGNTTELQGPDENFSLESLNSSVTKERQLAYESLFRESEDRRHNLESIDQASTISKLAGQLEQIDLDSLQNLINVQKERGLFGEFGAEELAQELVKIEQGVINPLIENLKQNDLNLSQEQIDSCIIGTREAFYSMILNGLLTADKILEIASGGIKVSKEPGDEIHEDHRHMTDIAAYLEFDSGSKTFTIHFYEGLFKENNKDIAFLVRHEFFHAAAYAIWGKRYNEFKEAAENPENSYASFEQDAPELAEVLRMIANPEVTKHFFRGYIAQLLEAIENAQTDRDKAFYRRQAAVEIVADIGAHFLEGSKSSDVLIALRSRYLEKDENFMKTICDIEGVPNQNALFARYFIYPDEMTSKQIMDRLSQSENLRGLFKASDVWQTKLSERFENRGEKLKLEFNDDFTEEDIDGDLELYQSIPTKSAESIFGASPSTSTAGPKTESAVSTFLSFWDIITGKK